MFIVTEYAALIIECALTESESPFPTFFRNIYTLDLRNLYGVSDALV